MDSYPIPASTQRFELEIKRSRFITTVMRVESRAQVKAHLRRIRDDFPTASHHCWASAAGTPDDPSLYDQSDDGEPRGTAGKPMMNVLLHSGLGNILVVVTRYFGGIKLGSGGLVRAYTQSVSEALKQLETRTEKTTVPLVIRFPYTLQGRLDHYFSGESIEVLERVFDTDVLYSIAVPVSREQSVEVDLVNLSQGQLTVIEP